MIDIAEIFARRLREMRADAGMSQTELAERLTSWLKTTVYSTTITKIEKRERSVRIEEAVAIAAVLDVPLQSLLSDEDPRAARLHELRRKLARQESRVREAAHEQRQARKVIAQLESEIHRLEQQP